MARSSAPRMVVFDSAYTYKMILERSLAARVTGRDLDGYFDHVWTIYPLAALISPEGSPERIGRPEVHDLAPRHTFIEGRLGRYRRLGRFRRLNLALAQIQLLWLAIRLVRRERIDIVRSEEAYYNGLFAWIVARLTGRPLVIGSWGNPGEIRRQTGRPLMGRMFKSVAAEESFEKFILRRADAVIVQNGDNRDFVLAQGVRPERAAIFRLGNVLHRYHFGDPASREMPWDDLRALGVGPDDELLLCISRLAALKLTDHPLRALGLIKDRCPRAKLLFIGEGPQREELVGLARELGIVDRVIFAGNRDQLWIANLFNGAAAVISPLTGRALAEAALGGAPIVAYDLDWQGDVVVPGETGELVPRHDIPALADAIERLLADRPRARRLGAAVRRHVAEMMDPAAIDAAQREVYRALIDRSFGR